MKKPTNNNNNKKNNVVESLSSFSSSSMRKHNNNNNLEQQQHLQLQPCIPSKISLGWILCHILSILVTFVLVEAAINFKDAVDALAFYGVYHREPYNQLIHFFGVPFIALSLLMIQAHLPITNKYSIPNVHLFFFMNVPEHYISWATITACFYVAFYLWLDVTGGLLYTPFIYGMYALAVKWTVEDQQKATIISSSQQLRFNNDDPAAKNVKNSSSWNGTGRILRLAGILHILSWYVQIHPGHIMIEGARPAVLQSVGGALSTAPLFAFYEGLWYIGLRHEFHMNVQNLVTIYTKQLCNDGIVMKACTNTVVMNTKPVM